MPAAALVLANLLAPLHAQWCEQLSEGRAQRPGLVIASGLLAAEADRAAQSFAVAGLHEIRRLEAGEWAALLLERDVR